MKNTNAYITVARQLLRNLSKPDLYLDILTSIKNPQNKKLTLQKPEKVGMLGEGRILLSGETVDDIFDFLDVEDSEMGAWQAVLLKNIYHVLPLWDHANYEEIAYVFENRDISFRRKGFYYTRTNRRYKISREDIVHSLQEQQKSVEPTVDKDGDTYLISFCYWNDWSGLENEKITITIKNGKPIFGDFQRETLYEYHCGILF